MKKKLFAGLAAGLVMFSAFSDQLCSQRKAFADESAVSTALTGKKADDITKLAIAIMDGDIDTVVKLKSQPDLFSIPDPNGVTLTHQAAMMNRVEILKIFYEIDPNSIIKQNKWGETCFHVAADHNHVETLLFLIAKNRQGVKTRTAKGRTPAHYAAVRNNVETLELLFRMDPTSLTIQDEKGNLPAHEAANNGAIESLSFIQRNCPSTMSKKDNAGETAQKIMQEKSISLTEAVKSPVDNKGHEFSAKATADDKTIRMFRRLTSVSLPITKPAVQWIRFADSLGSATMMPRRQFYDQPVLSEPSFRMMFFTSRDCPIKDISEVEAEKQQFAFNAKDDDIVFLFAKISGIIRSKQVYGQKEGRVGLWMTGGNNTTAFFKGCEGIKLFLTYAQWEDEIRSLGGVPVQFVKPEPVIQSTPAEIPDPPAAAKKKAVKKR